MDQTTEDSGWHKISGDSETKEQYCQKSRPGRLPAEPERNSESLVDWCWRRRVEAWWENCGEPWVETTSTSPSSSTSPSYRNSTSTLALAVGGNHKVPLAPLATRAGHSWEQQEEHEERKFQELGAKNASLLWKKRRRSIYIAFPALLFAENSSHPQSCQATAGKKQIPFLAQSATSESLVAPIKLLKSLSSAEVKPLKQSQILSLGLRCCRRGWLDCTPHLPSRSISEKWALAPHCPWQTLAILRVQGNQEYKGN